jgi:hypothetical protein
MRFSPADAMTLQRMIGNRATSQMLMRGRGKKEPAEQKSDYSNLLEPGEKPAVVGPYSEARKHSGRADETEAEHVFFGRLAKLVNLQIRYQDLPAMVIPTSMHRGGVSGAGGGITSTGSSATAKGWGDWLADLWGQGKRKEVVQSLIADEYNSAAATVGVTSKVMDQLLRITDMLAKQRVISEEEAGEINNATADRYYRDEDRRRRSSESR